MIRETGQTAEGIPYRWTSLSHPGGGGGGGGTEACRVFSQLAIFSRSLVCVAYLLTFLGEK